MTGPEHYREAERFLKHASVDGQPLHQHAAMTSMAQVHATLALAAATIDAVGYSEIRSGTTWEAVLR